MTGYTSVRELIGEAIVSLEMKALNHKGFDLHFHSSRTLTILEIPLREFLQSHIRRGRLEVFLRTNKPLVPEETIQPNTETARAYLQAAQALAADLSLEYTPSMDSLLQVEGVISAEENQISPEEAWGMIVGLVRRATEGLLEMKKAEGARLHQELENLLHRMETHNTTIAQLRNVVIDEYRDKLLARIAEWKETLELDPNRVMQEVAFFADRSDIQEETVRLKSHIQQFRDILQENHSQENYTAVGRRLDFLCQEMFREVNTIGSKSTSTEITRTVLDMKGTIEQVREQVQNIE